MTMSCSAPPLLPPCRFDGLVAVSAAFDGARFSRPMPPLEPEPEPEDEPEDEADDEPLAAHA